MGSPAVTPSAPAAPSAPAPSAPAPSSVPSSAPAASPTPPSSAPAPASPEAPSAGQLPVAPAAPAAPYDPITAPAPPKNTDYGNNGEDQAKFLTDLKRWEREHPNGEVKPVDVPPAAAPEQLTPEQQALKDSLPPEAQQQQPPAETPTPQALAEMMEKNPKLKEFFDANPSEKGAFFKMSRDLAELAPIRAIFPTEGDAKFAQEYSTAMVGLKTASMRLIDNPDAADDFLNVFDSQFQRVDATGQPILENGKPVFDPDRDVVRNAIFNSRMQEIKAPLTQQMADLKTKLAGAYPSDFARGQDQERLDNLSYAETALGVLDQILDGSFFESAPPEPPADATPEQKQWFENQKAELTRQKQELDDKQKGASKQERAAASQQYATGVRNDMGSAVATVMGNALKAVQESGVYIPEFYLQEKFVDPGSGKATQTSALAVRIFTAFENELMRPGSRTLMEITQHELLPQNDQTRQIRKDYYARKASEMIAGPNGFAQKEVDRIQSLLKLDEEKLTAMTRKRNEVAQPEPSTGGSSLPSGATRDQIMRTAEEMAAKDPEFAMASPSDKQARIVTQYNRMQRK